MCIVSKFLQKQTHFCETICYSGRAYLAVGHNSVGSKQYFAILNKELGASMLYTTKDTQQSTKKKGNTSKLTRMILEEDTYKQYKNQ